MHIEANRQAYRYNLFVESADKYKFNYRRVSYGQNTLGNTTGRLFVHRRLVKYPALVLHYSEEGAGAAAFFCTTNRGKLLQYKLIHIHCAPVHRRPTRGISQSIMAVTDPSIIDFLFIG